MRNPNARSDTFNHGRNKNRHRQPYEVGNRGAATLRAAELNAEFASQHPDAIPQDPYFVEYHTHNGRYRIARETAREFGEVVLRGGYKS